jgi:hypothetical protein
MLATSRRPTRPGHLQVARRLLLTATRSASRSPARAVSGGSGGHGGSRVVPVPTPCGFVQRMTGKEYYDYVKGGGSLGRDETGAPIKPYPGYEQQKDDDT